LSGTFGGKISLYLIFSKKFLINKKYNIVTKNEVDAIIIFKFFSKFCNYSVEFAVTIQSAALREKNL
jgi:hypothetical protein